MMYPGRTIEWRGTKMIVLQVGRGVFSPTHTALVCIDWCTPKIRAHSEVSRLLRECPAPERESEGTRCSTLAYSKHNIQSKGYMNFNRNLRNLHIRVDFVDEEETLCMD
jgi:hypothetical protein